MADLHSFQFAEAAKVAIPFDSFVAIVPKGVKGQEQLLQALYERLRLPTYFGFNWNALLDCLRDFHWLKQHRIFLVHEDLPILDRIEFLDYIQILSQAVRHWKRHEQHELTIVFPSSSREQIDRLTEGER